MILLYDTGNRVCTQIYRNFEDVIGVFLGGVNSQFYKIVLK